MKAKSQLPTIYKNNAKICLESKLRARLQRLFVLRTITHASSHSFYTGRWQQAERQTMEYNKYKIEDINIGDEIYFDSVPSQSNFDEYWTVHGKDNNQVLVNLKKEHYWTVKISEVRQHIKKPMNDN